ncbi:MAG: hypothetical protein ABI266_09380 [Ginsengibacter sp.]
MIAYAINELLNCHILEQGRENFHASKISQKSFQKIEGSYSCKLYTPGLFIAIGLGLVTTIALIFTAVLVGLMTSFSNFEAFAGISIFMTILSYFLLEGMVKSKRYFNAGVDNALMILVLGFTAGIFIISEINTPWILFNVIMMAVALWLSVRFTDALMAIISCAFFFVLCFLLLMKLGISAIFYFPFVMMLLSGSLYFIVKNTSKKVSFVYEKCMTVLSIFLLVVFYASGNYWVINEIQMTVFNEPVMLSFGWFYWIFTFAIPFLYIVYGIAKKDLIPIRTGIFLVMAAILTYKYFFTMLPLEIEMLLLGIVLITVAYFLIKWLRQTRRGFTSQIISPRPEWKNIEGLIIAETMSGGDKTIQDDNLFSGGSGGGGGASGDF